MWPFVDEYFSTKIIKDKLEPKIRKALSKLKLNDFEFDRNRIMLGTTPLRIGGIKVHDMNTSRDEIIVDMDLIFASDCSINFRLGAFSFIAEFHKILELHKLRTKLNSLYFSFSRNTISVE